MNDKDERELPRGIVKFTITREELEDILSEKYNVNVRSFSVEEEGISISLPVPESGESEEEYVEEVEEEEAEDQEETGFSEF